jgi:hypothetical protein
MKKKPDTKKSSSKSIEQSKQKGGSPVQDVNHDESRRNEFDPKVAKGIKSKGTR